MFQQNRFTSSLYVFLFILFLKQNVHLLVNLSNVTRKAPLSPTYSPTNPRSTIQQRILLWPKTIQVSDTESEIAKVKNVLPTSPTVIG